MKHRKRQRQKMSPRAAAGPDLGPVLARHQAGELEAVEPLYEDLLRRFPANADVLHFYGLLCHQRGRSTQGEALIRQAIEHAPGYVDARWNLARILHALERHAEEEACCREALRLDPRFRQAQEALARALEAQQRWAEAQQAWETLLREAPDYPRVHLYIGNFLRRMPEATPERLEVAISHLRTALEDPDSFGFASASLGILLGKLGRWDEVRAIYEDWVRRCPDDPEARHLLAAVGGAEMPARAGDDYVRDIFDLYAEQFDTHLVKHLHYRAPEVLVAALAPHVPAPDGTLAVLDTGCGTGLCGPLLKPWARELSGIDLSPQMVAKARARAVYDRLEVAEITAFLREHVGAFDIIVSADTLVYFGDLREFIGLSAQALRGAGTLAFTLEALDSGDAPVELGPSGRYRHAPGIVRAQLEQAGFRCDVMRPDSLRREGGRPVPGLVVVATRTTAAG